MKSLDDIKKENSFLVPEGYFDQLEQDVMTQVHQIRQANRRRRIYTISIAAAAVVALLVAINVWIFAPDDNASNTQLAEEKATSGNVLLASGSEMDVLSTGAVMPVVDFEESDFDNVDYQILDYYTDEMSQLDFLY